MSGRSWRSTARRQGKRLGGWLLIVATILVVFVVVFLGTPYEAADGSVDRVSTMDNVTVQQAHGGYVIEPADADPQAGLVFYPGARVAPSAYVESLAPLASEANVTVVVPKMPLNLAIVDYGVARTPLGEDTATSVIQSRSDIERWYVGGHSLGGAMACRYAREKPDEVSGLVLYAAYCDQDISETGLSVLSVVGTADTVLSWDSYEQNLANLPDDATTTELQGLNHTQFGSYTGQDDPSGTPYETAHARLRGVTVPWFQAEVPERPCPCE